ncbi:MAG: aminoglycoside phosphotransferase family protein [Deltaproteobacteria bacterium]|nr:aminoglycoside phosphotransferase family protein [Deltaproteobacteria bacterium]
MRQILAERENKTIWREGDEVLKVFEEGFQLSDILNEALNQARVMEASSLPIPKILEVGKASGKWAIRMDYVAGPTLAALMAREPSRRLELLERFIGVQIGMHRHHGGLLNSLTEKTRRKIDESGLDPSIRYELLVRLESMPRARNLLHGDFNPGNVVVGEGGKAFILDWSHATQGDPAADAARTYLLFRLEGSEETAEDYLEIFRRECGLERSRIHGWLPLVAAVRYVTAEEPEREFLSKWIDVVDFQ